METVWEKLTSVPLNPGTSTPVDLCIDPDAVHIIPGQVHALDTHQESLYLVEVGGQFVAGYLYAIERNPKTHVIRAQWSPLDELQEGNPS